MIEIKEVMIGSWIVSKEGRPQRVYSLQGEYRDFSLHPALINDRPEEDWDGIPVSVGLMTELGWEMAHAADDHKLFPAPQWNGNSFPNNQEYLAVIFSDDKKEKDFVKTFGNVLDGAPILLVTHVHELQMTYWLCASRELQFKVSPVQSSQLNEARLEEIFRNAVLNSVNYD